MTALRVRATGPLALVEDLGRPGHTGIGVGRSGAADRGALRLVNRLLGNPDGAAAVEVLLGGLEVEVEGSAVLLCLAGAPCEVWVEDRAVAADVPFAARPGERVRLGSPRTGLRTYLGVRGGIDAPAVLGSRSHDVMAGLGPPPLEPGARLAVGAPPPDDLPAVDVVPAPALDGPVELRVVRGPRDDRLRDADALVRTTWTASDRSNRVGMRLDGATLEHLDPERQLPSEGACRGAIQVPPGGEPVVFLADHPVTGGYPVAGVVVDADVDRAAQVRPGDVVRFRWVPAP